MNWNKIFEYKNGKLFWKIANSNNVKLGQEAGNKHNAGYREIRFYGKRMLAHRVIWEMFNGEIPKELQIDHINGKRDDNRIENLQLVTIKQNALRRFDGKNYSKCGSKYRAYRYADCKKHHLGMFGTPCGAYMASKMFYV